MSIDSRRRPWEKSIKDINQNHTSVESQHFQNETSLNLNETWAFRLIRRGYEKLN